MSNKLMTELWQRRSTPGHPEQGVLLALADIADDEGRGLHPSHSYLAWKTEYSERQVRRILKSLTALGAVAITRKGSKLRSTEYRLDLSVLPVKEPWVSPAILSSQSEPQDADLGSPIGTTAQPDKMAAQDSNGHLRSKHRPSEVETPAIAMADKPLEPLLTKHRPAPIDEKAKPRDPIWDGFVAWLGRSPETKSERGQWNKACGELRAIGVDNALEVERRGRAYQRAYSGIVPTPLGLVAHWSEFGRAPTSDPPWRPSIPEMTDEELGEASHG